MHPPWRLLAAAALLTALLPTPAGAERHVAVGAGHACYVTTGGRVVCGGDSANGRLGVVAGVSYVGVTAGTTFSCGLAANGTMLCWGTVPSVGTSAPGAAILAPSGLAFIDIHAAYRHVCGLTPGGTVYCYGDAAGGATAVPPGVKFQSVSVGNGFVCGVVRDHSVVCWGDATNPVVAATAAWSSITDAEHVATGADHACYVRISGTVGCWGANAAGQTSTPLTLTSSSGGNVWWLSAGNGTTCALAGDTAPAAPLCWGAIPAATVPIVGAYEVACAGWGCMGAVDVAGIDGGPVGGQTQVAWPSSMSGATATYRAVYNALLQPAVVSTLAGTPLTAGLVDGVGSTAQFYTPVGITALPRGSFVETDWTTFRLRTISTTGVVATVAGNGAAAFVDSANPMAASFNGIADVTCESPTYCAIADYSNHRIRLYSPAGITTLAGSGAPALVDGTGVAASFNTPCGVSMDRTNSIIWVADYSNSRVRYMTKAGTVIQFAVVSGPKNLAASPSARVIYVSSQHTVVRVTYTGTVDTLAGSAAAGGADGTGASATFNNPYGMAVDAAANAYAVEYSGHRLRRVTPAGVVTTVAGTGTAGYANGVATAAVLYTPRCVTVDPAGVVYFTEMSSQTVRRALVNGVVALLPAPLLSVTPAADDQLFAWRCLYLNRSSPAPLGTGITADLRGVVWGAPLAAAATGGLNPAITILLLGVVPLAARDPSPAAAAINGNATFSTSASRSVQTLSLSVAAVPPNSLAAADVTTLLLSPAARPLMLWPRAFAGLASITCLNCGGVARLANLSGLGITTVPTGGAVGDISALGATALLQPGFTTVDVSSNDIVAVTRGSFTGAVAPSLRTLILTRNSLNFVDEAAFNDVQHPALATISLVGNPLVTGGGCRAGTYLSTRWLAAGGQWVACPPCLSGSYCPGGLAQPLPCPSGTFCLAGAAVGTPCPPGLACPPGVDAGTPCTPGYYCPPSTATATLLCPAGSACPAGSSAPSPCPAGVTCPAGVAAGTACPAGWFCAAASSAGPVPCFGGSYCPAGAPAPLPCIAGHACALGSSAPLPCPANAFAAAGAAACTSCSAGTYVDTALATRCVPCGTAVVSASCGSSAVATWRTTLTVVADGAGAWAPTAVLVAVAAGGNVTCGPLVPRSATAATCSLPLLSPAAATHAVVAALGVVQQPYVVGSVWLPLLGASITVVPPPLVVLAQPAATVTPLTGGDRLLLQLPLPRPVAADWSSVGAPLPPLLGGPDGVAVWLRGGVGGMRACTGAAWESATLVSCTVPAGLDGVNASAIVALADAFNLTTGPLPASLFPAPQLTAYAPAQLLPPPSTSPVVTLTVAGVGLCAGVLPRITNMVIGGVPCSAVACTSAATTTALCVDWDTAAAAAALGVAPPSSVTLNVTASWANYPSLIRCTDCVSVVTRPVVLAVVPPTIPAAGVLITVAGTGFGSAPSVLVGGASCGGASLVLPDVVRCVAPSVLASAPGYPVVRVQVMNAAGAASTDAVSLTYPTAFAASWNASSLATPLIVLPGAPLLPAPVLSVLSREAASCSLTLNATGCAPADAAQLARPVGMTVLLPVGGSGAAGSVPSSGTPNATTTALRLSDLVVGGASGCTGALLALCIDANGNPATTAGQPNPVVTLPSWRVAWTALAPPPLLLPPSTLPTLTASFQLSGGPALAAAVASGALNLAAVPTALTCLSVLMAEAAGEPPHTVSLDRLRPQDVLSSAAGTLVYVNARSHLLFWPVRCRCDTGAGRRGMGRVHVGPHRGAHPPTRRGRRRGERVGGACCRVIPAAG